MKIEFVSVTDGFPEGNEPSASGGRCSEASDYRRNGVQGSNRVYAALGESQWQRSTMTSKSICEVRVGHRNRTRFDPYAPKYATVVRYHRINAKLDLGHPPLSPQPKETLDLQGFLYFLCFLQNLIF